MSSSPNAFIDKAVSDAKGTLAHAEHAFPSSQAPASSRQSAYRKVYNDRKSATPAPQMGELAAKANNVAQYQAATKDLPQ